MTDEQDPQRVKEARVAAAANALAEAFGHAWGETMLVGIAVEVLRLVDEAEGRELQAEPREVTALTQEDFNVLEWAATSGADVVGNEQDKIQVDGLLSIVKEAMVR